VSKVPYFAYYFQAQNVALEVERVLLKLMDVDEEALIRFVVNEKVNTEKILLVFVPLLNVHDLKNKDDWHSF
jgi:hypothetical protein